MCCGVDLNAAHICYLTRIAGRKYPEVLGVNGEVVLLIPCHTFRIVGLADRVGARSTCTTLTLTPLRFTALVLAAGKVFFVGGFLTPGPLVDAFFFGIS